MTETGLRLRPASVLFALVLLSPLLFVPGYGFDGPRVPVVLGLLAILLGLGAGPGPRAGRSGLLGAAGAVAAAHLLSLAVAPTPGEAATGLVVLGAGLGVFVAARSGRVAREFARSGVPVLLAIVGLGMSAIGIVQRIYGLPAVSTEGNPNYAGALAGMLLPALAGFSAAGRRRMLCLLAAAALLSLLILSRSRGGWVGAVAGMAVTLGGLTRRRVPGARGVAALGLLLVAVPLALQGREQLSPARSSSIAVRIGLWKGAARILASHPFLGVGTGNFAVVYPQVRSEEEFRASQEVAGPSGFIEAEDAHSSWAQEAAEGGILGFASLVGLVLAAGRLWWRRMSETAEAENVAYRSGLGGGVAGFLVAGLFNTLTFHLSPIILFWGFLGLIELEGATELPGEVRGGGGPARAVWVLAALIAAGISGGVAASDREFTLGMSTTDPATRAARLERAAARRPAPWKALYFLERARAALNRPAEAAVAGRETLRLRPHHVMALNNTAASLLRTPGGEAEAERLYRHAVEVAPYYYLSHYNLGLLLLLERRIPAAREELEWAVRTHERHAPSRFALGETWALEGKPEEALVHFRQANLLGFNSGRVLRVEHPELGADPRYRELDR